MNPITHGLMSWTVAVSGARCRRDRLVVTLAGVIPDIDGLGAIVELATRDGSRPLYWFSLYHHTLGHNVGFALLVAAVVVAAAKEKTRAALLALVAFHLHLWGDLIGSRGPDGSQWPIPYFLPFASQPSWIWSGQWELNAWQNVLLTLALVAWSLWFAWRRGMSPVGLVSSRADEVLVTTLRERFGPPYRRDGE